MSASGAHHPAARRDPAGELRAARGGAAFLLVFGAVFAIAGLGALVGALPDALAEGDDEAALAAGVVGALFVAVGAAGAALGRHALRRARDRYDRRLHFPDAPWMWEAAWARREIPGSGRATMLLAWSFAGVWNALALPLLPKMLDAAGRDGAEGLFALLFPAIGLGLAAWAVRATLAWRRHGRATFEPTTLPGVVGGELEGVVHLALRTAPEAGFTVELDCVRRTPGRGDRQGSERILWQEKGTVPAARAQPGPRGLDVPVCFRIPGDESPTGPSGPRGEIFWRLTISARTDGVDLCSHFVVPVFVTEDSDATLRMGQADAVEGDEKARTAAAPADDPALAASKIGVRAQPGGGVELAFGPARNPALAVPFTAVGIVFAGVVVLLPRMEAPLPLLLVFGAIDLLVLAFALKLWTGTVRVRADREGLTVVRRILGIGRRTRIDARDVERIEAAIGWQSGRTVYYALRAVRRNGGTTGCGDGLRDKREAEGLAERLEGALRGD